MKHRFMVCGGALGALFLISILGCNRVSDTEKQLAELNGQASADRQVQANNEDLQKKINEAKQELVIRQRFYQGVSGTYEGQITKTEGSSRDLNTRIIISPTVPEYTDERYRTLDEIQTDLRNLALNVEVVQWDAETGSTWGCFFNNAAPDMGAGSVRLQPAQAGDCPIAYRLWLMPSASDKVGGDGAVDAGNSSAVASALLSDRMASAPAMAVEMDPIKDPHILRFIVKRGNGQ